MIYNFIKNEYIYSILTKFFTMVISLLQSVFIARYLGPTLQGISSYISSLVSVGSIIITFGLHQAYPYLRKKYGKEAIYEKFISVIYIIYAIYFLISVVFAVILFPSTELKAVSVLIPIYGYNNAVGYICLVEKPNKRNNVCIIISIIDAIYVFFLYLFFKSSIVTAVSILLFAKVVESITYTIMLHVKPYYKKDLFPFAIKLFKMGFFPMLALLMTTLNYKVDILMLRSFTFISDAQIGVYSIGMLYADKVVLIPDTLKGVLVSKLSKGADEHEVAKVSRLCFWSSVMICIAFWILGESFINMMYGEEYQGAYKVLLICSLGSIFIGYFKLIAQYNIVNRKQVRNVVLLSLSIVINIMLNLVLIPKWGLNGAAVASGVGYFFCGIVFVIWFAKRNHIKIGEMFLIQKKDFKYIKKILHK